MTKLTGRYVKTKDFKEVRNKQEILLAAYIFVEFKGALTEQYVLSEFKTNIDSPIFYWSADKGIAEVDYIIQIGTNTKLCRTASKFSCEL